MKKSDLIELVRNGESSKVEFKSEDVHPSTLAEEIVALANFQGGSILIGVEDDGVINGVHRPDIEPFIVNVCRNNIKPSILPSIETVDVDGHKVVVVTIAPGETPHATGKGLYFIRVGSTKQVPTQQELLRLFQKRNVLQVDETPVIRAGQADIRLETVNEYLLRMGQSPLEQEDEVRLLHEMINLTILIDIDGYFRPTLAGLLAFGKRPQRFFPSYTVMCGAYRGKDVDSGTVRETNLEGTLDRIIEDTMSFLRLVIPQDRRLTDGVRRSDAYLYPIEALREGLVNAVCHRDYTIEGSAVRVLVFTDRIEIRSPGGLPNTLTLDSMAYRQFSRNQVIASFLSGLGYIERRGKGILRIRKRCKEFGIDCRFELTPDNNEFVVTLTTPPSV